MLLVIILIITTCVLLFSGIIFRMNLLKIAGFALFGVTFFSAFANSLPQIKTKAPQETEITGQITMEQFTAIGRTKFDEICFLCHNPALGGRAPDPSGISIRASERIKHPKYKEAGVLGTGGSATTAEEYLRESIRCPSCFVVEGFGVKGTNDMESPMAGVPQVKRLTDLEVDAVIAFYQQRDGLDITVQLPTEKPAGLAEAGAAGPKVIFATGKETPEEIVTLLGCGICHTIPGVEGATGLLAPKLEEKITAPLRIKDPNYAGTAKTAKDYIKESIINPNAYFVFNEAFGAPYPPIMPPDFGEKLSINALDKLADFLLSIGSEVASATDK